MRARFATSAMVLAGTILVLLASAAPPDESPPPNLTVVLDDGSTLRPGLQDRVELNVGNGAGLAGKREGHDFRLDRRELLNQVARIDFLTRGIHYMEPDSSGRLLLTLQDGRQIVVEHAYFPDAPGYGSGAGHRIILWRHQNDVSGAWELREIAVPRSIELARAVPLKCEKCNRLLSPDFSYCPYDGHKLRAAATQPAAP